MMEIYPGIVTCVEEVSDDYHRIDMKYFGEDEEELERDPSGECKFYKKGTIEKERKELIQFFIDNKNDYHELERLKNILEDKIEYWRTFHEGRITSEEWDKLKENGL